MNPKVPITERVPMGMLLAATAGSLDAYTYLARGGVFAGLQTGNMILMGVSLGRGDWAEVITHLIPFLVFACATVVVRGLQHSLNEKETLRRRALIVIGAEGVLALLAAALAPILNNVMASSLVAIIAAAQLQEFRKLNGKPFMSIMMTGNLRTAAAGFYDGIVHGSVDSFIAARNAAATIIALIAGATLSALTTHYLGTAGIIFAVVPILGAFIYLLCAQPLYQIPEK